jgi:flagellar protein FliL
MGKLVPVLLMLVGLGGGVGAGVFLRPEPAPGQSHDAEGAATRDPAPADPDTLPEFVKLSNQFIVPVVEKGRIVSLVILSLSVEVDTGTTEQVFAREPRLRDAILQMLFDHANTGGFRGSFTDADNLVILRRGLKEVATRELGSIVRNVLITDIVRQDS